MPLTVATAVGLLRRRDWAAHAFYAVLGWYGSVAGMALVMLARDDPAASGGRAALFTVAAVVFTALAARVFVPLLRSSTWAPGQR